MAGLTTELHEALDASIQSKSEFLIGLDLDQAAANGKELDQSSRATLRQLATNRNCELVVFSHDCTDEMRRRLDLSEVHYAGNSGLELCGPGVEFQDAMAEEHRGRIAQLAEVLKSKLGDIHAVAIENHGLTIRVHFDNVNPIAHDEVRRRMHTQLANSDHPFMISTDQLVHHIRPRTSWTKASALHMVKQQMNRAGQLILFIGGAADEESFALLEDHLTIRVGESPETRARFTLANSDEVRGLLQWMAARLR